MASLRPDLQSQAGPLLAVEPMQLWAQQVECDVGLVATAGGVEPQASASFDPPALPLPTPFAPSTLQMLEFLLLSEVIATIPAAR